MALFEPEDSLSEHGQDWDIIEFFNQKQYGYYVDFEPGNGKTNSNTFILERNFNWGGISFFTNKKDFSEWKQFRINPAWLCDKEEEKKDIFLCLKNFFRMGKQIDALFIKTENEKQQKILTNFFEKNEKETKKDTFSITFLCCTTNRKTNEENARTVFDLLSTKNYQFLATNQNTDYYCLKSELPSYIYQY